MSKKGSGRFVFLDLFTVNKESGWWRGGEMAPIRLFSAQQQNNLFSAEYDQMCRPRSKLDLNLSF